MFTSTYIVVRVGFKSRSNPVNGYRVVGVEIIKVQSKFLRPVQVREDLGIFQQRFAGYATPIEADPTQRFALNDGGFQS